MGSAGEDTQNSTSFKLSTVHYHVKDCHEKPVHFLLPSPEHPGGTDKIVLPEEQATRFSVQSRERPFDPKVEIENVLETVTVGGPRHVQRSCASLVNLVASNRVLESVKFGLGTVPRHYKSSVVVQKDCTKRNFKNTTFYEITSKPRRFAETLYLRPRDAQESFVSYVDYHPHGHRKWFKNTVNYVPITHSRTDVVNFQFLSDSEYDSDLSDDSVDYAVDVHLSDKNEIGSYVEVSEKDFKISRDLLDSGFYNGFMNGDQSSSDDCVDL